MRIISTLLALGLTSCVGQEGEWLDDVDTDTDTDTAVLVIAAGSSGGASSSARHSWSAGCWRTCVVSWQSWPT